MNGGPLTRIFLYGTLRRGGSQDATVFYAGVEFVGPAHVRGTLFDLDDYPGLRLDASGGWVRGELFDVTPTALAALDEWEGISAADSGIGEYRRVRTVAHREDGTEETVGVYEISAARCEGRPVIVTGDWLTGGRGL